MTVRETDYSRTLVNQREVRHPNQVLSSTDVACQSLHV